MATHAQPEADERRLCWCCDNDFPDEELVHLGAHPEVALCFDCARWVRRRAILRADAGRRGMRVGLRRVVAQMRAAVIGHGWHDRPVIGPILRWIDRRMP
ncbi:hypothetical protein [Nocardioides sp. NPDC127503]|uniref:hypothetical protein n=1 Tax=Nocardioides sp. NPDC127503 TaxID=3154516 RepID=UPI0033189B05